MRAGTASTRREAGFTLIELLTAMAIGLILVLGVVTVYDSFSQSVRYQNAVAVQADSGRYAIDRLVREVRMSGYREQAWVRPPLEDALVVEDGNSNPDSVTVRYQGAADCTGNPTVGPDFIVSNRFDVLNGNFRCNGEVLATGVEDFQILLGEDTDADGAANRILPPGAAGLDPARVNSVRLYLLMATPDNRIQRFAQTFTYFGAADGDGQLGTFDDGRHRLELATVLAMRNPMGP